jgi:hypothetical protein
MRENVAKQSFFLTIEAAVSFRRSRRRRHQRIVVASEAEGGDDAKVAKTNPWLHFLYSSFKCGNATLSIYNPPTLRAVRSNAKEQKVIICRLCFFEEEAAVKH